MATQHTLRKTGHGPTIAVVGFAALVATALIGAVFMALRPSASVERAVPPSAAPVRAPAAIADPAQQGVMGYLQAHSLAAPETAAADPAQQGVMGYLRAHSLAAPAAAPPATHGAANRIFADEIAGASTGATDWAAPDAPAVLPQRGPR